MPISPDYGDTFADWELAIAHKLVREFRSRWPALRKDDPQDQLQDVLLQWYLKRSEYDPAKEASIKTYCAVVIRNKLTDLVKEREREKRRAFFHSISLTDEETNALIDRIPVSEDSPATQTARKELELKISSTLQKLKPRQQKLYQLRFIERLAIDEISVHLGIKPRTINNEIKRIRQIFEKEGVKEYLP